MGLKKGQTNNPNGRPAGTKNKVNNETKNWIKEIIDGSREQFLIDLKSVDPEKRLLIIEKLMKYVVPSLSAVSVEAQISAEYSELEKLLDKCPEDVIDRIVDKIEALKNLSNEKS